MDTEKLVGLSKHQIKTIINNKKDTQHYLHNTYDHTSNILSVKRDQIKKTEEHVARLDNQLQIKKAEFKENMGARRVYNIHDELLIENILLSPESYPLPEDADALRVEWSTLLITKTMFESILIEQEKVVNKLENLLNSVDLALVQLQDTFPLRADRNFRIKVIVNALSLNQVLDDTFTFRDTLIDQNNLEELFTKLTEESFNLYGFKLTDIQWVHNTTLGTDTITKQTIDDLIESGKTKFEIFETLLSYGIGFIPAAVYCGLDKQNRDTITWIARGQIVSPLTLDEVLRYTFFSFFFIFTQAKWPDVSQIGGKIAKETILADTSQLGRLSLYYSCTTTNLSLTWIEEVDLTHLPIKIRNRFALGCAGYRVFNAIKSVKFQDNVPLEVLELQQKCSEIVEYSPDKNVHPAFRSPVIISKYGSLNKQLNYVLARFADQKSLADLADNKIIYEVPKTGFIEKKIYDIKVTDFINSKMKNFN